MKPSDTSSPSQSLTTTDGPLAHVRKCGVPQRVVCQPVNKGISRPRNRDPIDVTCKLSGPRVRRQSSRSRRSDLLPSCLVAAQARTTQPSSSVFFPEQHSDIPFEMKGQKADVSRLPCRHNFVLIPSCLAVRFEHEVIRHLSSAFKCSVRVRQYTDNCPKLLIRLFFSTTPSRCYRQSARGRAHVVGLLRVMKSHQRPTSHHLLFSRRFTVHASSHCRFRSSCNYLEYALVSMRTIHSSNYDSVYDGSMIFRTSRSLRPRSVKCTLALNAHNLEDICVCASPPVCRLPFPFLTLQATERITCACVRNANRATGRVKCQGQVGHGGESLPPPTVSE